MCVYVYVCVCVFVCVCVCVCVCIQGDAKDKITFKDVAGLHEAKVLKASIEP